METEREIQSILAELDRLYPDAAPSLEFSNPLELLISTILSAQCTDERVNQVTKKLFCKYRSLEEFAQADLEVLEQDIRSTGFFRNKARSIRKCCQAILEQYGGKVPSNFDNLVKLPGVGRKTANVVLGGAFGIPSVIVDTHASRVSQRLGLTQNTDAHKIEFDLRERIPVSKWTTFSHQLIQHGRRICTARKPKCLKCSLRKWCRYFRLS
nr:endonuclease III [Desulfobacterales bacterium]